MDIPNSRIIYIPSSQMSIRYTVKYMKKSDRTLAYYVMGSSKSKITSKSPYEPFQISSAELKGLRIL